MRVKYFVLGPVAVRSDAEVWGRLMTEITGSNPTEVEEIRHIVFLVFSVGIVLGNGVVTLTVLAVILLTRRKTVQLHTMELLFISLTTYRNFWNLTTLINRYKNITSYSPLSSGLTPVHLYLWLENNQHPLLNLVFFSTWRNKKKHSCIFSFYQKCCDHAAVYYFQTKADRFQKLCKDLST
jgi:hypothetical protein